MNEDNRIDQSRTANWPIYQGTKQIRAVPMTTAEYCLHRGWQVPADEDPAERGYIVEDQNGGFNVEGYDGYISWVRADVFERSYHRSGTYLERMKIEAANLSDNLSKLNTFMDSEAFDEISDREQRLLRRQEAMMFQYNHILAERIMIANQREEAVAEAQGRAGETVAGSEAFVRDEPVMKVGEPVVHN